MLRITLKNYRCFSDSQPAFIDFDAGFTAFIGTNNSGKSSFLRFFHEFKNLFSQNQDAVVPKGLNFNLMHAEDWVEIFHNQNQRDIVIEIVDTSCISGWMERVTFTLKREVANHVQIRVWVRTPLGETVEVSQHHSREQFVCGNQIVSGQWTAFANFFKVVANSLYIGPFRNAISEGQGRYYDISIGTTFIQEWDAWKTGPIRANNEAAQKVTDDIAHIFDFNHFEINATPNKNALQVIIGRRPYGLRELGAGLAQFIIVFGNVAIRRPTLLLIDEPELNLHPSLQIDFLTSLASYASYGVIFASHSVGLARAVSDRIYTFQKIKDCGTVKPFEQTPNFAEFIGEMSFSSFKEVGYDRVLLVEGVSELKAIQQFLRALRKDHSTVLLPLGGTQMIRGGVQNELHELSRLSQNVSVLIDSERETDGVPLSKDRESFITDCQKLGFKTHVTRLRAFENYFSEQAIKEEKGNTFLALGPYEKLAQASQGWAKSDNWRIARRMTRDEILATDVGKFLESI